MDNPDTKNLTELLDQAIAAAVVARGGGGWLHFGETKLAQGVEKSVAFLAEHAEVAAAIEAAVAPRRPAQELPGEEASGTAREAPSTGGGTVDQGQTVVTQSAPPHSGEFITLSFPLPADLPGEAFKNVSIVVKAKPAQGRWRAGRKFTREESVIPHVDLSAQQIEALTGDSELIVSVRVPRPG